jgi:phosphoglycolate phosphatase
MIEDYPHVIWDWNGTLLDDSSLSVDIINSMLIQRSLPPLTLDRYRDVFTFPVRDYYQSIGFDLLRESFDDLSLEEAGRSQSVLSAHPQETLTELVETFSVAYLFQRLIGLENSHAISKTHQGKRLLAMLSRHESQVSLIGNTLHDAEVTEATHVAYSSPKAIGRKSA